MSVLFTGWIFKEKTGTLTTPFRPGIRLTTYYASFWIQHTTLLLLLLSHYLKSHHAHAHCCYTILQIINLHTHTHTQVLIEVHLRLYRPRPSSGGLDSTSHLWTAQRRFIMIESRSYRIRRKQIVVWYTYMMVCIHCLCIGSFVVTNSVQELVYS